MSDRDYEIESIGQVYAQALVNLAQKQNVLPEVTEDIRSLKAVRDGNESFANFLGAVTIAEDQKIATLLKIFGDKIHPLTLQTLNAMARRERLVFLPGLFSAFEAILEKMAGRIEVELVTAQVMSDDSLYRIKAALTKSLGQEPSIEVKVDERLIGGMRLKVGDTLMDGSVETQLQNIGLSLRSTGTRNAAGKAAQFVTS